MFDKKLFAVKHLSCQEIFELCKTQSCDTVCCWQICYTIQRPHIYVCDYHVKELCHTRYQPLNVLNDDSMHSTRYPYFSS